MKILFIAGKLDRIGGIEKYNRTFVNSLKEAGANIVLAERNPGGFFSKMVFAADVFAKAALTRPDYIVCTHLYFSPLCLFLKKLFNFPYSVSVYGVEVINIVDSQYRKALGAADKIIYLFNATAENVIRQIPGSESKMFNLPNSVDGGKFKIKEKSEDLVEKFGLKKFPTILTIGRIPKMGADDKGYRRVVKAMPMVLKEIPNAKYLLVGGGDDVPGVKELIAELGLEESVIMADAPSNEEIVDYYNLGDVFILPSKNEGFPAIVLLEALACGVPVIGGDQKGAEDAMLNGELGVIVPADDVTRIGEELIRMLKKEGNPRLYNKEILRNKALGFYGLEEYGRHIKGFLDIIKK